MECELCQFPADESCKDCHFYRHAEAFYSINNRPEWRVKVVMLQLVPKGKWHLRVPGRTHIGYTICSRKVK